MPNWNPKIKNYMTNYVLVFLSWFYSRLLMHDKHSQATEISGTEIKENEWEWRGRSRGGWRLNHDTHHIYIGRLRKSSGAKKYPCIWTLLEYTPFWPIYISFFSRKCGSFDTTVQYFRKHVVNQMLCTTTSGQRSL